jgi:hypothetical protein
MRVPATSLPLLLLLFSHGFARAQKTQSSIGRIDFTDPRGILHQLSPEDTVRPDLVLAPADKAETIRLLIEAKQNQTGWHRQLAIYYLAYLGQDQSQNVRNLLQIWRSAGNKDTMALIIQLYRRGHSELLVTILKAVERSDAALAEELGDFYGDQLSSHPRRFIAALSHLSVEAQKAICGRAGASGEEGTKPQVEGEILRRLAILNSPVAARCIVNVKKGFADAEIEDE